MKLRSGLLAGSVGLGILGASVGGGSGLFAPQACVSPALLIALTALPADSIGAIVNERLQRGEA